MANILFYSQPGISLPKSLPQMKAGKLNCKVRLRNDYAKAGNDLLPLYIQVSCNRVVKRIPLGISIGNKDFDLIKQRVRSKFAQSGDYNLIIEKKLADINTIEINYRLQGKEITLDGLFNELNDPTSNLDFIRFWENEMIRQKDVLKDGTYKQQISILNKVRNFQSPIFFYSITEDFVNDLKAHYKKQGNNPNTISTMVKSFKKYLHIANKKGINTPCKFDDIKNTSHKGNRTFLMPDEIQKLYDFYKSPFINSTYKVILQRFLFSCFTGVRFSDTLLFSSDNFFGGFVAFTAEKTGKFQRIKLNETAKEFLDLNNMFGASLTNQYINRELKLIAKAAGITKRVTYHVSRHSFATNFLMSGGRVEVLQKILGHSSIEDTMIYVHIVDQIMDEQIDKMDGILSL